MGKASGSAEVQGEILRAREGAMAGLVSATHAIRRGEPGASFMRVLSNCYNYNTLRSEWRESVGGFCSITAWMAGKLGVERRSGYARP
jgi:hypothetical protein